MSLCIDILQKQKDAAIYARMGVSHS